MQENYRLDSILGVCDAKHLMSQLSEVRAKSCVNEASEQVASLRSFAFDEDGSVHGDGDSEEL